MTSRRLTLGAAIAGVLALAACLPPLEQVTPSGDGPWPGGNGTSASAGDANQSGVYHQRVNWSACGTLECATIKVPLDWRNPDGATITLELNRSKARKPAERLGTVVINPGGPGGSGLDLTAPFVGFAGDRLLDHYDIVGFDPRGVGSSTPLNCGTGAELDAYFLPDDIAQSSADIDRQRAKNAAFAQNCSKLTGALIENVDTASAARDMDVIRAVVGDQKLNYLGFSYGSQLGATYAVLYPQNVGHMVLDGAVDFLLDPQSLSEGQAKGFEASLGAYIADCISGSSCPLPRDPDLAKRAIRDLITEARDTGIPAGRGKSIDGTMLVYGIVVTLYDQASWSYLTQALDEAINKGTGSTFLQLANFYLDRDALGKYTSNATAAFTAISCLDEPPQDPTTIADLTAYRDAAEQNSPTFGWWFASGVGCDGWPWTAHEVVQDLTPATHAGPIVIVGTTHDPATPLAWAQALVDQLPNSTLLTYDGEGHTAYGRSNQCVIDAVDGYFVDGVVPPKGTTC